MKVILVVKTGRDTKGHRVIEGVTQIREYSVYVYFGGPTIVERTRARRSEILEMTIEVTP